MKISSRLVYGAAGLVAIVVAVAWMSGWFDHKIQPGTMPAQSSGTGTGLQTVEVRRINEPMVEWASGAVQSAHRTTIAARILARIEQIEVNAGDLVDAGDVLVRLDARALQSKVQQAREFLNAATAQRNLARTEFERAEALLKKGVSTRQRFEQASSAVSVAAAEVDRLNRVLEEAETSLSYAEIRAPSTGRVIDRLSEPGDTVAPGQAIMRLYDPAVLRVEVPVRETLAVGLKLGDELPIEFSSKSGTTVGRIAEIVPYSEPGARTLLIKVLLPQDQNLFEGMFARVGIPAGERARLVLPASAVQRVGQLEFVTVTGAGRRAITTGEAIGQGNIEALSGLREGESVVVPAN